MNSQKGQVLLITVMLLSVVLTITLALAFRSTTETQITKLEEESQKTLAAAEAGVEGVIKNDISNQTYSINNFVGNYFSGTAQVSSGSSSSFVTPLLPKDGQYTFYLADYKTTTGFSTTTYYNNRTLNINFRSETDCPAIELTFITDTNGVIRKLIDPCNLVAGGNKEVTTTIPFVDSFPDVVFQNRSQFLIPSTTKYKVVIVRSLFASTKIGFHDSASNDLLDQGKFITSTARASSTGVVKKVQLFQSFPQIPAEFFVTSF